MDRREFLKVATLSSLTYLFPWGRGWAFSNGKDDADSQKLIVIFLRGAADGLNVVAPYGDAIYHQLRPTIALPGPGLQDGVIDLDGYFGLHPALAAMMPFWRNKTLAFVHASGSPDSTRSHFDAQDYMESGVPGLKTLSSGWLNRLVSQLPSKRSPVQAISLGPVLPRIFAGLASVATVPPNITTQLMAIDRPAVAESFKELYQGLNNDLGKAFAEGISAHHEINEVLSSADDNPPPGPMNREEIMANRGAPTPRKYNAFGQQLAGLFRKDPSIQIAFLDFGGWDTHVNQGAATGQLANHLTPLAQGLADLVSGLGPLYKKTSIIVMSEFGRTAHENGNGGTDHGHGNVMWLLGGQLSGGKVYGRWAGLSTNALHEARDLPTTTDFRAVLCQILIDQLGVSKPALAKIFPDFRPPGNPFLQT